MAIATTKNFPGCWEATLHSTVRVLNNNTLQLEVKFKRYLHGPSVGGTLRIPPGCKMWLPCSAGIGFFSFRPSPMSSELQDGSDDLYDWSEPVKLTSNAANSNDLSFRIICTQQGRSSYHMVLKMKGK